MKTRVLAACWLLVFSSQSSTISGLEGVPKLVKFQESNLSKQKFGGNVHGGNITNGLYHESDHHRKGFEGRRKNESFEEYYSRKVGGKGKGTGSKGGKSADRLPRYGKKNAASAPSPYGFLIISSAAFMLFLPCLF